MPGENRDHLQRRRKGERVRGRKLWAAVIALVLLAALIAGVLARRGLRPEAASLLQLLPPGADLYGALDLETLQSNPAVRKLLADQPGFSHDPQYDDFLRQTSFRYQDDLKQMAFAKLGDEWAGVARVHLDRPRLLAFFSSVGAAQSAVQGHPVYSFGSGRPFRLALLEEDVVAFSVGPDATFLGSILERPAGPSGDSAASELERTGELQRPRTGSQLWLYGKLDRLLASDAQDLPVGPFRLGPDGLQGSRVVSASVQSSPLALDVLVEDRCDSAASAEQIARWLKVALEILRVSSQDAPARSGPDYATILEAVSIDQADESVYLRWRANAAMLAKLAAERP